MFYLPKARFIIKKLNLPKKIGKEKKIEIKEILKIYGIENIENYCIPIDGNRGQNIILKTIDGKKLLKRYKSTLNKSTIIQEHSILKYLSTVKFFAPRLCDTETGETLFYSQF